MKLVPVLLILALLLGFLGGFLRAGLRDYFDHRVYLKQKAKYLQTHPLHSGSEPIVWRCECGHTDNNHDRSGCVVNSHQGKAFRCACLLTPRQVRDRF
jgi:hypothetical protein